MDVASRLKDIREHEGLGQRPFAARVSAAGFPVSSAAVSGYESGRTGRIPADYVSVVCREFGWSPRWVLWGEGPARLETETDAHQRLEAVRRALGEPVGAASRAPEAEDGPSPEFAGLIAALTGANAEGQGGSPAERVPQTDSGRFARERAVWAAFEARTQAPAGPRHDGVDDTGSTAGVQAAHSTPAQRLQAEGWRLHDEGDIEGAAELHERAYEAALQAGEEGLGIDAALRFARCRKLLADWGSAVRWYQTALDLAETRRDWNRFGRALGGLADLRIDRGALPAARDLVQRMLVIGQAHSSAQTMAWGYYLLNQIESESGDHLAAVRHCWRAVEAHDEEDGRTRAIFSAGTSLLNLGHIDAAEDAYVIAALRIRQASTWILALSALTYTAAIRGEQGEFDRRVRRLSEIAQGRAMPRDRSQILFHTGESLALLGHMDEARHMFGATIRFAEANGLSKELIKAEKALRDLDEGRGPRRRTYVPPDDEIRSIHSELLRMREEAVASPPLPTPANADSRVPG